LAVDLSAGLDEFVLRLCQPGLGNGLGSLTKEELRYLDSGSAREGGLRALDKCTMAE
jgi:hypothetical protein